jgi:putative sterol carrier protein
MMVDVQLTEFFTRMVSSFDPQKAAGLDATIQLNLTGDRSGNWYVTLKDQKCALHEGTAPQSGLKVTANSDDFMNIFTGKLDGMQAFMQGKLKVAGDMSLAMKLLTMFKMK